MLTYVCKISTLNNMANKQNHLIGWVQCVPESKNQFKGKATLDFDDPTVWLEQERKPVIGKDGDEWIVVWDVRRKSPGPRVHQARWYRPGEDENLLKGAR